MTAPPSTAQVIHEALMEAFAPSALHVLDDSAKHAGHAGARDGGGHFHVFIESARFAGQTRVLRHRQVYAALNALMGSRIHALAIEATVPGESLGNPPSGAPIQSTKELS